MRIVLVFYAVEHRVQEPGSSNKELKEIRKGQGSIMSYLICQELNLFKESVGKLHKSLQVMKRQMKEEASEGLQQEFR